MLDAIKSLVDNGIINEATRDDITEAWEAKLSESREQVRAELREEFAGRYEHDKSVMVEAINKMVTESLTKELSEFAEDKRQLSADRVKFKMHMRESAKKFEQFLAKNLAKELKEFRVDRVSQRKATQRLEKFVIKQLAEEITEFSQDKQMVVETKVRLVSEAKRKMTEIEKKFITRSAKLVKEAVASGLKAEMTQLKEDITTARENMFGRRIFETFASEFTLTHLNENQEINKLRKTIAKKDKVIAESRKARAKGKKLLESKERDIRIITESADRSKKMDALLGPLKKDKASVMSELLESVQTSRLDAAFEKYLPAVLNGGTKTVTRKKNQPLTESRRAVTGNKSTAKRTTNSVDDNTVIDIKRLAGL